jgi:transposase
MQAAQIPKKIEAFLAREDGLEEHLFLALERSVRQIEELTAERRELDRLLGNAAKEIPEIRRLMTIPGVGVLVATTIYAWVGDVSRFRNARALCAYAGLVPSVNQSGTTTRLGHITRQGAPILRRMLVQSAQVISGACRSPAAQPLQEILGRVASRSERKKIATVALARHILRIAYYILRDGTEYDPRLLMKERTESRQAV